MVAPELASFSNRLYGSPFHYNVMRKARGIVWEIGYAVAVRQCNVTIIVCYKPDTIPSVAGSRCELDHVVKLAVFP